MGFPEPVQQGVPYFLFGFGSKLYSWGYAGFVYLSIYQGSLAATLAIQKSLHPACHSKLFSDLEKDTPNLETSVCSKRIIHFPLNE